MAKVVLLSPGATTPVTGSGAPVERRRGSVWRAAFTAMVAALVPVKNPFRPRAAIRLLASSAKRKVEPAAALTVSVPPATAAFSPATAPRCAATSFRVVAAATFTVPEPVTTPAASYTKTVALRGPGRPKGRPAAPRGR